MARVSTVNIGERKDNYHLELAARGLKKEDFKLSLKRNVLNISVDRSSEDGVQKRNYNKREFSYSWFVHFFMLPDAVDVNGMKAKYVDGVIVRRYR